MDRQVSLRDRIEMRLHLLICPGCRRFVQQLNIIRAAFVRLWAERDPPVTELDGDVTLSAEARERIRKSLS
jgi:hypothetical protein